MGSVSEPLGVAKGSVCGFGYGYVDVGDVNDVKGGLDALSPSGGRDATSALSASAGGLREGFLKERAVPGS